MRWTIRGVNENMVEMIREVAANSDLTLGECLNEAIQNWYESLPEEENEDTTDYLEYFSESN